MTNHLTGRSESMSFGEMGEIQEIFCKKTYYITIDGFGVPGDCSVYEQSADLLYRVIEQLREHHKANQADFDVKPLETLWWKDKDDQRGEWNWRNMIEIPGYVTEEELERIKSAMAATETAPLVKQILIREMNERRSLQTLHTGPYEQTRDTIERLHRAARTKGYVLRGLHHEIYLNDPRREDKKALRTMIRRSVFREKDEELNYENIKRDIALMLKDQTKLTLSTTDGEKVSSRFVSVVFNAEKFYFQTDLGFRKSRDIEKNKNVALCINNLQIEGIVTDCFSLYDEQAKDIKALYKKVHPNSYQAYSKLMDTRFFEITPLKAQLYSYEGKDAMQIFVDHRQKIAYKRWYLLN